MYESQVSEHKYEIERLARELQEVKKKYFMQKKKEQAAKYASASCCAASSPLCSLVVTSQLLCSCNSQSVTCMCSIMVMNSQCVSGLGILMAAVYTCRDKLDM